MQEFYDQIKQEFVMSIVGELTYFLGLQVKQLKDGIFISQSKYAKDLVKKFGLEATKHMRTPMGTIVKLTKNENGFSVDPTYILQPPPSFEDKVAKKKPSLEDMLSIFIVEIRGRFNKDEARLDSIETHCSNMRATMKSLEVQLRQLASSINAQQKGNFPSFAEKNPK